jgi:excisionase family DNA binding protein
MRPATPVRQSAVHGSPWITPKEAAAYVGVGIDTIYAACQSRALRHAKIGHSTIRLTREWVDAWVHSLERA